MSITNYTKIYTFNKTDFFRFKRAQFDILVEGIESLNASKLYNILNLIPYDFLYKYFSLHESYAKSIDTSIEIINSLANSPSTLNTIKDKAYAGNDYIQALEYAYFGTTSNVQEIKVSLPFIKYLNKLSFVSGAGKVTAVKINGIWKEIS
jgi:hypothetical protein